MKAKGGLTPRQGIAALLAALACACVVLELLAGVGLPRVSRLQRRIHDEQAAMRSLRPVAEGRPTLLLVGNSLMLSDIDLPRLRTELAPKYVFSRYVIENTQYWDWYFGLRRIMDEGSRPKVILVGMSTRHLVSSAIRGDYFAHYLMRPADFLQAAWVANLSPTPASNLLFASRSSWFGSRAEIRGWLLGRLMPDSDALGRLVPPVPKPTVLTPGVKELATERLRALREIGAPHGVRIVFLLPPTPELSAPEVEMLKAAGESAGVPILTPAAPGEYADDQYADGFHLNEAGASRFTTQLRTVILERLGNLLP